MNISYGESGYNNTVNNVQVIKTTTITGTGTGLASSNTGFNSGAGGLVVNTGGYSGGANRLTSNNTVYTEAGSGLANNNIVYQGTGSGLATNNAVYTGGVGAAATNFGYTGASSGLGNKSTTVGFVQGGGKLSGTSAEKATTKVITTAGVTGANIPQVNNEVINRD